MNIRYTLSFPHPPSHLVHVRIDIRDYPADFIDLVMPSWVPGSYKIRDFARHVQGFGAGKHQWKKQTKSRWRVVNAGARQISVEYDVFCFELTVQCSHMDDQHAFINPGNVLMYVDDYKDTGCSVVIRPPRGWKIATGMEPVKGKRNTFATPNYDIPRKTPHDQQKQNSCIQSHIPDSATPIPLAWAFSPQTGHPCGSCLMRASNDG